jgi:transcription antitermination factor NusG
MTEKKWYAVYTRPRWEKKVADLLTRKNIENYCPLNKVRKKWADRIKTVHEPLFTSYVFVHITEAEQINLKNTDGVINLIYWLGKPAVISNAEIEAIRRFLDEHYNVTLEKTQVNLNDMVKVISGPLTDYEGQVVAVKSKTVKIILPSLGYLMSAEVETTKVEVVKEKIIYTNSGNNVAVG